MKNYLLGMATVIIFGPIFKEVIIKTLDHMIQAERTSK